MFACNLNLIEGFMNVENYRSALRKYIVYRIKLMEFFDLSALRQELDSGRLSSPMSLRDGKHIAESLRTIQISHLSIFIDKSGMNVFNLWLSLFPDATDEIEKVRSTIEAPWEVIRKFRNKVGFHVDNPEAFFRTRREVVEKAPVIQPAIVAFTDLAKALVKREDELVGFIDELANVAPELEFAWQRPKSLSELKRYLLLPR